MSYTCARQLASCTVQVLTFSPPDLVPLLHDGYKEVLVPVAGRKDNAVVKEVVNGVHDVIAAKC